MLSMKIQNVVQELEQIDVLLEMMIKSLVSVPIDERKKSWFEKLENALYLLEATYKEKKKNLISALEGGISCE